MSFIIVIYYSTMSRNVLVVHLHSAARRRSQSFLFVIVQNDHDSLEYRVVIIHVIVVAFLLMFLLKTLTDFHSGKNFLLQATRGRLDSLAEPLWVLMVPVCSDYKDISLRAGQHPAR